jgi:hypothetical protein
MIHDISGQQGGRSTWCSSIEDEVRASEGELATGGWAHPKRADHHRTQGSSSNVVGIRIGAWWVGKLKAEGGSLNRPKGESEGMAAGDDDRRCHVPPSSLTQRHYKDPVLGLRSCLASAENYQLRALPLLSCQ